MRIVCPSCSAAYDVPDSLLTPERIVRCARCSGEWMPGGTVLPEPEAPATLPEASDAADATAARNGTQAEEIDRPPVAATAMDRLAANPAVPPPRYGLRVAWAGSLVLLALLAGAAYSWRSDIIHSWPPSARMYAAFGLHADTQQTR